MGNEFNFCDCKNKDNVKKGLQNENNLSQRNLLNNQAKPNINTNVNTNPANLNTGNVIMTHNEEIENKVKGKTNSFRNAESEADMKLYSNYGGQSNQNMSRNINAGSAKMDSNQYDSVNSRSSKIKQLKNLTGKTIAFYGDQIEGKKVGFGIQVWDNETKYVGRYNNDKANGWGQFFAGFDVYEGEFKDDGAHGYGIYKQSTDTNYEGYWVNDSQDEIGIEKWKDGSEYRGEYKIGKKHGIGTYNWIDGSKYEGEWIDNCLEGYGIYYFPNNRIYLGHWKNNMKSGYGEFICSDKKFFGYYEEDKKNGFGVYFWKNMKKAFMGFFKDGKQSGFGKFMTPTKKKYGIWGDNNLIVWIKEEEEADKYLLENGLENYTNMFHYTLDDIATFCMNNEQGEKLLEEYIKNKSD